MSIVRYFKNQHNLDTYNGKAYKFTTVSYAHPLSEPPEKMIPYIKKTTEDKTIAEGSRILDIIIEIIPMDKPLSLILPFKYITTWRCFPFTSKAKEEMNTAKDATWWDVPEDIFNKMKKAMSDALGL